MELTNPTSSENFYSDDMAECAECGHLHFNEKTKRYLACPMIRWGDGCDCLLNDSLSK